MEPVAAENEEALEAWDGVLFDRFLQFREIVTAGLGAHGEAALATHPPRPGDRVLDIGCGFGDTSLRIAGLVGDSGSVLGVDVAPRFIEAAQAEAEQAGGGNVSYRVRDVQVTEFEDRFDYAFARFGTMFFANPVAAMRNVRRAMAPGGRLCIVVWRRKLDNDWLHRAEKVVEDYLEEPEETDEPTCGPGPFSMANADTVSDILQNAGFAEVALQRCDIPIQIGRDLDHAVEFVTAIGPAGEVIRLAGDAADEVRPQVESALREALADFAGPDGVWADASTWIVSARAPQSPAA
ncbi:MAG TPA: class I SAM-dependent methyltransferase [Solirubrobacterales bacterium]|jgi:ubiquinone/menaquinone biosynthesis C-methylase UbiE|nr:class I SAM-dependent methyltransferase [Solirubrobacterales bacterium]